MVFGSVWFWFIPLHALRDGGSPVAPPHLVDHEQIIRGQYKGLVGTVVEATDSHVKVELHTKPKKIFVARHQVRKGCGKAESPAPSQLLCLPLRNRALVC